MEKKNITIFYVTGVTETFNNVKDVNISDEKITFTDEYGAIVTFILSTAIIGYAIADVQE